MAIEIFNRQELKFIISPSQMCNITTLITEHMSLDKHNENNQTYKLYNLYIDTQDSELIRNSLSRPIYKEKIRVRSYHPFSEAGLVYLEVKKRYKRITNKRRTKITFQDALLLINTGSAKRQSYMNQQVLDEFETMFRAQNYIPKTFITYDRLAYTSLDERNDFRITFDSNLTASRTNDTKSHLILDAGQIIMEVKTLNNLPLWLVEFLASAGIHKQGYSKYGQEYLKYLTRQTTTEKIYYA